MGSLALSALTGILEPICLGLLIGLVLGAQLMFIVGRIESTLDAAADDQTPSLPPRPHWAARAAFDVDDSVEIRRPAFAKEEADVVGCS